MQERHHALLLIGTPDACRSFIPSEYQHGADADIVSVDTLGIDEARALALKASSRPVESDKRRFIISVAQMTLEAQNALLKLFEDPPATAQFYLIVPRRAVLIPTLLSRLHILFEGSTFSDDARERAHAFLRLSYAARLEEIAALQKAKDAPGMRALIASLEQVVAEHPATDAVLALREAARVSPYAEIRGASHKMLLEHLALSLPVER